MIVTNHDLVLSDLRLGGGVILPAPEDSLYVFDEGHQLPAKCLNQFALRFHAAGHTAGAAGQRALAGGSELRQDGWQAGPGRAAWCRRWRQLVGDLMTQRSEDMAAAAVAAVLPDDARFGARQSIAFPMAG